MKRESFNSEARSFRVIPGHPESQVIVHVPHASTVIPDNVRAGILLSDADLLAELALMTDALTDEIAEAAAEDATLSPWLFINLCSRLVIDPERFPNAEDEVMDSPEIGMGAVYLRTSDGQSLRTEDPAGHSDLIESYFRPYSDALATLVEQRLAAVGRAVIIDLHSFPREELPYERLIHADFPRPECCIGTDPAHTPPSLVTAVKKAFAPIGECRLNEPFAGTYVPLPFYQTDERVSSVMVELRRDIYLSTNDGVPRLGRMLANLIDLIDMIDLGN